MNEDIKQKKDPLEIDSVHYSQDIFGNQLSQDIWNSKYRFGEEHFVSDTMGRICDGVYELDPNMEARAHAEEAMHKGLWLPGGRINAGAGTSREVTLHNCYVSSTMEDSIEGIADNLKEAMVTLKRGGGIGMDFSPLRPRGAELKHLGEGAYSSGAVSFMKIWNAASLTIMSAGSRRGAMMGTLHCSHPDLLEFIEAKQQKGVLEQFNISILCTDEFMNAVRDDKVWRLYSEHKPVDANRIVESHRLPSGHTNYCYHKLPARVLWDQILKSTYDYAEPGVIFIDRINNENNLQYIETISTTNPCSEQPLPPHGACDLGHVNVARMVVHPFSEHCEFNFDLLRQVVKIGVRFLDNVIDVSDYPLTSQMQEQHTKRRIGLGMTGLADALAMMRLPYFSPEALALAEAIARNIAIEAYATSIELAQEKGPFPVLDKDHHAEMPFVQRLPEKIQRNIRKQGIRNGVLLTQAPVGTGSLWYGNVSSGIEPIFALSTKRKVLQADNTWKEYVVRDYAYDLYRTLNASSSTLPPYFSTTQDLTVNNHIDMQACVQKWVDASISKTVNCAEHMTFEEFRHVYHYAYEKGCKNVSTYRPSVVGREVRGSILEVDESKKNGPAQVATTVTSGPTNLPESPPIVPAQIKETIVPQLGQEDTAALLEPRPRILQGSTYQLKWPHREAALYMTINNHEGSPHEVLFTSRSMIDMPWLITLGRMLSAMLRLEIDVQFICNELSEVRDAYESAWIDGKQYGSLVALIGDTLRRHIHTPEPQQELPQLPLEARACPKCSQVALIRQEGCDLCYNCGYSKC